MSTLPESGQLAEHPLPKLLLELERARFSGALELRRTKASKRILLQTGAPVAAESDLAAESLAGQLLDSGRINREERERVQGVVAEKGCTEGAALLALELIDAKALFHAMKEQLRRRIVECFAWSDGEYRLDGNSVPPEDVQPFRCDPYRIVHDGLRTHWTIERLGAQLAPQLARFPHPTARFGLLGTRLPDGETYQGLLSSLDGRASLAQALGHNAAQVDALAAVWMFEAAGGLIFQDEPVRDDNLNGESTPQFEIEVTAAGPAPHAKAAEAETASDAADAAPGALSPEAEKLLQEIQQLHEQLSSLSYYELLGVDADVKTAVIKKTYFQAAKRFHPDALARLKLGEIKNEAAEVFARINEAYEVLKETNRRSAYDDQLASGGDSATAQLIAQAETFFRKGEVMLRMGDFRGALGFLENAVELWPEECDYQSALGWTLYKKSPPEPERALEALEKAVTLGEQNAVALFRLGSVLRAEGDSNRSAELLARAKQIDPNLK